MKYIVVEVVTKGIKQELPFIFPKSFIHADMFAAVYRNYIRDHHADSVRCVGAGFINSSAVAPAGGCHGFSESLDVKSRGEKDDATIPMLDYTHGIVL